MGSEAYSKLCEVNIELAKRVGKKTLSGLKKAAGYTKDSLAKSADTARNAIVAGAVAPVGAGIAQKYNQSSKEKKDPKKYSESDVAARVAALRKNESLTERLKGYKTILEDNLKTGIKPKSTRKKIENQKIVKELKNTVKKAGSFVSNKKQAKDILKGSPAMKKALQKASLKGGLKGAAVTAGLAAAAYGAHKLKDRSY